MGSFVIIMVRINVCSLVLASMLSAVVSPLFAQQNSEYGWALSPRDTLRVLIFFVEIDYDESPELGNYPDGTDRWKVGGLPDYADDLFDVHYQDVPTGKMSKYYREISLDNLIVLGDYYPELIRVPYSKVRNSPGAVLSFLGDRFGSDSLFMSKEGLTPAEFDYWMKSPGIGKEKSRATAYTGVDHVMLIVRNYHRIPTDTGQASPSSSLSIAGARADTYSIFGGGRRFPFGIMKHEVNHLFLGGNNFHSGGGNAAGFASYLFSLQGGWSMMGAANSSLLTCTAWDRYRLGWKARGNEYLISARDSDDREVNADLNPNKAGDAGIYVLRDFATTGDAMRIALPYIPKEEFQQWIWIENHTTKAMNGSDFDQYQYDHADCTSSTPAGLFMQVQIDAEAKEGRSIYNDVYADYLRPLLANGMYDFQWGAEPLKLEAYCINGVDYNPYALLPQFANPFTGNHEQEFSYRDLNEPLGTIDANDGLVPMTRLNQGSVKRFNFLGSSDHAFNESGNRKLGLATNPSSANTLTVINNRSQRKPNARNNRTTYLNGVSIEILHTFPDGSIKIQVSFNDHIMDQAQRWCSPLIVLNNHNAAGPDLLVKSELTLDRGQTPLRFNNPDTLESGSLSFAESTVLRIDSLAEMRVEGSLVVLNDSKLELGNGSILNLERGSRIRLNDKAILLVENGTALSGRGRVRIARDARIYCKDENTYNFMRGRTWQKRRVVLQ